MSLYALILALIFLVFCPAATAMDMFMKIDFEDMQN